VQPTGQSLDLFTTDGRTVSGVHVYISQRSPHVEPLQPKLAPAVRKR
jgi:hypothetical protein